MNIKDIKKPITIGSSYCLKKKEFKGIEKEYKLYYSYKNISKLYPDSWEGWVSPSDVLPIAYDLVLLDVGRKVIPCWRTETKWEGLHLKNNDTILAWKLKGCPHEMES